MMWLHLQRRLLPVVMLLLSAFITLAQPADDTRIPPKPYRILTVGKQVTVKSTKAIKNIMVWTSSGHRIVEQRGINTTTYTFNVSGTRDNIYFVMLQYANGKPYTEKIGISQR